MQKLRYYGKKGKREKSLHSFTHVDKVLHGDYYAQFEH